MGPKRYAWEELGMAQCSWGNYVKYSKYSSLRKLFQEFIVMEYGFSDRCQCKICDKIRKEVLDEPASRN